MLKYSWDCPCETYYIFFYLFQDPIIDDQNTRLPSLNDVRFIENPSSFGSKELCVLAAWMVTCLST